MFEVLNYIVIAYANSMATCPLYYGAPPFMNTIRGLVGYTFKIAAKLYELSKEELN